MNLKKFAQELQRRNVIKAAFAYMAVAWVILQASSIILPIINAPESTIGYLLLVLMIIFPAWIIFAWIYEYTPDGFRKTENFLLEDSVERSTNNRMNAVIIASLTVAVLLLLADRIFQFSEGILDTNSVHIRKVNEDLISVAIFPFKTSGHEEIEYLGEGMMDLISTKISALEGMNSFDPNISNSLYKSSGGNMQEILKSPIWKENRIDYLLTGSIIKLGNVIKITGSLSDHEGMALVPIESVSENIESIFKTIESFSFELISKIHEYSNTDFTSTALNTTSNFDAIKEYLLGESDRRKGNYAKAYDHYSIALNIDSTFALAWIKYYTNFHNYFPQWSGSEESVMARAQLNKYKSKLPPQIKGYFNALSLCADAQYSEAISRLNELLRLYGDNTDVLFLLGDVKYHTNFLFGRDNIECKSYFEKVLEYDANFKEVELHLLEIAIYEMNTEFIVWMRNKYPKNDPFQSLLTISHDRVSGKINSEYSNKLFQLTNTYQMAYHPRYISESIPMISFMRLNLFDEYLNYFEYEKSKYESEFDNYNRLHYQILITQGKYREAFKQYPEIFHSNWYANAAFLYEKTFQPFTIDVARWIISEKYNLGYNENSKWHSARMAMYYLIAEDMDAFQKSLDLLYKVRDNELTEKAKTRASYFIHLLNAVNSRFQGNNKKSLIYLDSLYSHIIYHDQFRPVMGLYGGIKFLEAEILLQDGNISKALKAFENLDFVQYQNTYMPLFFYAPIKFRLGYINDLIGEKEKASDYFKYFITIYGDCDEFYQHNVQYARKKIEEYESIVQ